MKEKLIEEIKEVGIDANGRLYVTPKQENFEFIWRYAAGVNWDKELLRLYSPVPTQEMTYYDWFKQIQLAAEYEYGIILRLKEKTSWNNIPDSLKALMQSNNESERTT